MAPLTAQRRSAALQLATAPCPTRLLTILGQRVGTCAEVALSFFQSLTGPSGTDAARRHHCGVRIIGMVTASSTKRSRGTDLVIRVAGCAFVLRPAKLDEDLVPSSDNVPLS